MPYSKEELVNMAMAMCELKAQEKAIKAKQEKLEAIFKKVLNPGESITCANGTVEKSKKGKGGFQLLGAKAEADMEVFKNALVKQKMGQYTTGEPYIKTTTTVAILQDKTKQ